MFNFKYNKCLVYAHGFFVDSTVVDTETGARNEGRLFLFLFLVRNIVHVRFILRTRPSFDVFMAGVLAEIIITLEDEREIAFIPLI